MTLSNQLEIHLWTLKIELSVFYLNLTLQLERFGNSKTVPSDRQGQQGATSVSFSHPDASVVRCRWKNGETVTRKFKQSAEVCLPARDYSSERERTSAYEGNVSK